MQNNKVPCRKAFTETILEEAIHNKDIFIVTSDSRGSATLDNFAISLPEQFLEVGIAEQNAIGVGAGLATCGKNVFVCGPACFYTARSLEQVKVDVAYTHTNVKIIGISGGVSYGALGATHHSLHDIAVLRTFPNLNVYIPSDRFQTISLTRHLAHSFESAYMRLGRNAVPDIYKENDRFIPGKATVLTHGMDLAIIASGETVWHALKAETALRKEGIKAMVIDMHTLKPVDVEIIIQAASTTGHILTIEEHSIYGGLGAIVAEITSQSNPVKIKIMGFPDEYLIHANSTEIFKHYGLTSNNIKLEALKLLSGRPGK
jgi:transketolase